MDDHTVGRLQGQLLHQVLEEIDVATAELTARFAPPETCGQES